MSASVPSILQQITIENRNNYHLITLPHLSILISYDTVVAFSTDVPSMAGTYVRMGAGAWSVTTRQHISRYERELRVTGKRLQPLMFRMALSQAYALSCEGIFKYLIETEADLTEEEIAEWQGLQITPLTTSSGSTERDSNRTMSSS